MEDKREQILEAAKILFNRQGYSKTSVDDISQAVGMRKSSLYYYFKNKEDLFMSSFRSEWEKQFRVFEAKASEEQDPAQKIIVYIGETLDYYEQVVIEKNIPVKSLIETRNMYRSFVSHINRGGIEFFVDCLNEGIEKGLFQKDMEVEKVATTISLIKFSIQYDQLSKYIHTPPTLEDWDHIRTHIIFAIELVIKGIRK